MRIVMQPARRSEKDVDQHYRDTILNHVVFDDHADVLGSALVDQLKTLFPVGDAPMWGIVPGKNEANLPQIRKMGPGDWVFFSGDKRLYFGGTIALMWRNEALARRLWGNDHNGNTWEYMYALIETRGFDVPIEEVRSTLSWNPNRNIMGITVLSEEETDTLQELLSLDPAPMSTVPASQPNAEPYDNDLERRAERMVRGEQDKLRDRLLPKPLGQCALCGRILPRELLVAAHIKKRAVCTDDEKRDLDNIAMPACTFGCDALYERGYITVDADGKVQMSPLAADVPDVADYINATLVGNTVTCWTEARNPYFHWHRTHTFKESPPA